MKRFLLLVLVMIAGYAQATPVDEAPYDVMFWKGELRLKPEQIHQLQGINHDLYTALYELKGSSREELAAVLSHWKTAMIDVLTPRQKRKWDKIISHYGQV